MQDQTQTIFKTYPAAAGNPQAVAGKPVILPGGGECRLAEIVPNKVQAVVAKQDLPTHGIAKLLRQQDGRYIPVIQCWSKMIRLSPTTPADLGLEIHPRALRRLVNSGLVAGARPCPDSILMDLRSLVEHLEASREPGFWNQTRLEQYKTTF